jgi:hypothetical protein
MTHPLRVEAFDTAAALLNAVERALLDHEQVNSLLLGILRAQRRQNQSRRRYRPLFASVFQGDRTELIAAMTSPHKVLVAGEADAADPVALLVSHLRTKAFSPPAVFGPSPLSTRFAEAWAESTGQTVEAGLRQQLYELREVTRPAGLPDGVLRPATYHDSDGLAEWVHAFQVEALPSEAGDLDSARYIVERLIADEQLFVWQETQAGRGQPLSMAAKARPLEQGVSVNLVYTPPEWRSRGFASACVAALSRQLLDEGWRFITLFTDRSNATSNHIYREIGYRPIADFDEYRFVRK